MRALRHKSMVQLYGLCLEIDGAFVLLKTALSM